MTSFQKIIKYGAIAFAIYLVIIIVGAIVATLTTIFGVTIGIENYRNNREPSQIINNEWTEDYSNIKNLEIELSVCKLQIKKGDKLKVETYDVSNQFECKANGNTLKIKDKKFNISWFESQNYVPKVIIYIPENITFDKINIETGVNDSNIEYLNSDKLDLQIGVGKCEIQNISAKSAKIECGAGETIIKDSTIDTLKLESGIGKLVMTGKIEDSGDIDSGVGKLELNLKGNESKYKIKAETGLGNFTVNGNKVRDDETIGNGNVAVKVNAGVGETTINIKE